MRPFLALLLILAASASCSDGAAEKVYFSVGAKADWSLSQESADGLGYHITVVVVQRQQTDGTCAEISGSTRFLINGAVAPLSLNPESGCMEGTWLLGPYLQDQTLTVAEEEVGQIVATAVFRNLFPGTAATLLGPAELRAGDDIVVRPVPDVPAGAGMAVFYLLDDPAWQPGGIHTNPERRGDGLHVPVPSFTGRAVLVVWGTISSIMNAEVTCPGFAACLAESSDALGPFFVTGVP
jgi:hypothetical protein